MYCEFVYLTSASFDGKIPSSIPIRHFLHFFILKMNWHHLTVRLFVIATKSVLVLM